MALLQVWAEYVFNTRQIEKPLYDSIWFDSETRGIDPKTEAAIVNSRVNALLYNEGISINIPCNTSNPYTPTHSPTYAQAPTLNHTVGQTYNFHRENNRYRDCIDLHLTDCMTAWTNRHCAQKPSRFLNQWLSLPFQGYPQTNMSYALIHFYSSFTVCAPSGLSSDREEKRIVRLAELV